MIEGAGAVTASSAAAAEAGAVILGKGGNAIDAAVAAALASCVADPCNTGLGGYGGHMVVAGSGADPACVDFDMWVPEAESAALTGRIFPSTGPGASAVPNVVAGLALALNRLGSKTWAEVSEPAIMLASGGVDANSTTARAFKEVEGAAFLEECFAFERAADQRSEGDFRFRQHALAETLEQMATSGPEWFYEGRIADGACKIFQEAGFSITRRHWAEALQAATLKPAPNLEFNAGSLYSAPLGTSGSASMFATFAAGAALSGRGDLDDPEAVLSWARSLAAMWSFRFGFPKGNTFNTTTTSEWVQKALEFNADAAVSGSTGHTCHLNVCDKRGTLVAVTLTHGPLWFGGRWVVPGSGVVMNAGMHLLTAAAPIARDGRSYAVTHMSPTVAVLRDGSTVAIGCPGARRIPTIVGLVLARHLVGGLSLQEAVSRGRFHAEDRSKVTLEFDRWKPATALILKTGFEQVEIEDPSLYYGPLTAIRRNVDGRLEFGLDDRVWKGFVAEAK